MLDDRDELVDACCVCGEKGAFLAGSPRSLNFVCMIHFIWLCENIANRMRVYGGVSEPVESAIDQLKSSWRG